jgi:endonuclease YncB( thermonuclease family)
MRRVPVVVILAIALVAAACDARPQAPEFTETTTTTTTLPGGSVDTTTTLTLPPAEERVTGIVNDVTDGDTVTLSIAGADATVRLLGINAPEMTECWGPEAFTFLSNLLLGREVLLVAGDEDVDPFGRLLRFLYLEDGADVELVNATMVETGNAVAVQGGNPFAPSMKASEARAYQSGRGMWGTFACGDTEGVTADRPVIRVDELSYDPVGPDDDALDQEYITIVNEGYGRVSIAGWVLRDESSTNRLTFPRGTVLAVGDTVTVVTGCDGGPSNAIHWCSDTPVWSNDGDTAIVSDTLGNAVIWYTYSGSDDS